MVYGMTQAEEANFDPAKGSSAAEPKTFTLSEGPWRAYKVRVSIAFNMLPLPIIVRIVGVSAAFEPISSSVPVSAMNCSRASMGFLLPKNESQLRALMKVPEQDIEQVWRDFISGHGKGDVRAKHVETFVKERYGNLPRRKRGRGKGGKQCENLVCTWEWSSKWPI